MDDFLAGDGSSDDGETAGGLGRTLSSLGLILGLGTLAAQVWVVRGDRHELGALVRLVRAAGQAGVVGGVLELDAPPAATVGSPPDGGGSGWRASPRCWWRSGSMVTP